MRGTLELGLTLTLGALCLLCSACNGSNGGRSKERSANPPQTARDHTPKICIGWNPDTGGFGRDNWEERTAHLCPINYAIVGLDDQISVSGPIQNSFFSGECCPLPAGDILTSESTLEFARCPDDTVITGSIDEGPKDNKPFTKIRCTRINTNRYKLAAPVPGSYWGIGSGIHSYAEKHAIKISDVPAAIRSSIGRRGFSGWDTDGCIGYPPGSLVSSRSKGPCSDVEFRELQFRGIGDDPPEGTPVKMFPECTRISDIFDPNASCINDFEKAAVKEH